MNRKKITMGLGALTAGLTLFTGLAFAPAASAAECHLGGALCGEIYNAGDIAFDIIHKWGEGPTRVLQPGQHSSPEWADTDGFAIGPGQCAQLLMPEYGIVGYESYNGPATVQIHDNPSEYRVTVWNHPC